MPDYKPAKISRSRIARKPEHSRPRRLQRSLVIFASLFFTVCAYSLIGTLTSVYATNVTITGIVFEDANYGGGLGRSKATSSGVGQGNVRVELYDSTGTFVSFTTTATSGTIGQYVFTVATGSNYTVRVVNSSVTSS